MTIVHLSLAVLWPYFFYLTAKMARVGMNDFAARYAFFHCMANSYGWFCIKRMKWRQGMLVFVITGSLPTIIPLLIDPSLYMKELLTNYPPWYMRLAAIVFISYWDIILLSMVRWFYSRPRNDDDPARLKRAGG